jgi:Ca2+-binding RTX toxin-like protein
MSFPTGPTPICLMPTSDLSDLPGIDDAVASKDGEIVIELVGDNDVTTGDDDDLIVTGQGDDVIDAGDGDNAVYADSIPEDSSGGDDIVTTGDGNDVLRGGEGNDILDGGPATTG